MGVTRTRGRLSTGALPTGVPTGVLPTGASLSTEVFVEVVSDGRDVAHTGSTFCSKEHCLSSSSSFTGGGEALGDRFTISTCSSGFSSTCSLGSSSSCSSGFSSSCSSGFSRSCPSLAGLLPGWVSDSEATSRSGSALMMADSPSWEAGSTDALPRLGGIPGPMQLPFSGLPRPRFLFAPVVSVILTGDINC